MKVLFASDGSPHARAAFDSVLRRQWPKGTQLRILSVARSVPFIPDPFLTGAAYRAEAMKREAEHAEEEVATLAEEARRRARGLHVSKSVRSGPPKREIVDEAETWRADLVVVGSHGHGAVDRFQLGSVASAVAHHAPCSVEIVRTRRRAARKKQAASGRLGSRRKA